MNGITRLKPNVSEQIFYVKSNHLGNFNGCWFCEAKPYRHKSRLKHSGTPGVQVVVSDKRISVCDEELEVEYFKADVLAAMDYYPFGMMMPDRQWYANSDSGLYNFGFGGQMKDDELSGVGNSYTAEYWQYDPRLGRRFNIDPKPNPSVSYYACFANNPIWFKDPLGDTIRIYDSENDKLIPYTPGMKYEGDDSFISATIESLNKLHSGGPVGRDLVSYLSNIEEDVKISHSVGANYSIGFNVAFNPNNTNSGPDQTGNETSPVFVILGHELAHVMDYKLGITKSTFGVEFDDIWYKVGLKNVYQTEKYASHIENQIRAENNLPLRTHYSSMEHLDGSKTYSGQLIWGRESLYFTTTTIIQISNPNKCSEWVGFMCDQPPANNITIVSPFRYE